MFGFSFEHFLVYGKKQSSRVKMVNISADFKIVSQRLAVVDSTITWLEVIENLGATQNHFDAINLSDNDLTRLNNMPPLSRLRALYVQFFKSSNT